MFKNPNLNGFGSNSFDNILKAFTVLFEVASGDDWESVMYCMADIPTAVDGSPYRNDDNALNALFGVVFAFIAQLFTMQLLISVVIDAFYLTEGSGLLTESQFTMNDITTYGSQLGPVEKEPVPEGWRAPFYHCFTDIRPVQLPEIQQCQTEQYIPSNTDHIDHTRRQLEVTKQSFAESLIDGDNEETRELTMKAIKFLEARLEKETSDLKLLNSCSAKGLEAQMDLLPDGFVYICGCHFDTVITVCIVINILCMCTVHFGQTNEHQALIYWQNLGFNIIFTVEMTIKHIGLGCKTYWTDVFNAFDGFVVIVSWLFAATVDIQSNDRLGGIFRIGRVFRLVKRAPNIKRLLMTIVTTMPALSNVFMVLLLLFFVFAVMGVEVFGQVRYGATYNVVCNMSTWSGAMHMLWRAATGSFRAAMYDLSVCAWQNGASEIMLSPLFPGVSS